ncbi:hypothetical protein SCLCIDRAFT_875248 [Scleroderma citrinum Foug A]|uniref:Uncharacterized protein n=1 Tax=Scleroderma citrinum Foug A TaxID=1036808 RepID=A0A0C2ZIS1_9AGAM|nr:hypothetical protein SCLCIDRAFT_875248 [Scleroderma citrinum Foug A]
MYGFPAYTKSHSLKSWHCFRGHIPSILFVEIVKFNVGLCFESSALLRYLFRWQN